MDPSPHLRRLVAETPWPSGRDLKGLFDRVRGAPLRAALVGRGIQQSRTPRMHQAEGERLGVRYAYDLLDFDRLDLPDAALPDVVRAAARDDLAGLNVTHPFKQSVVPCLDELSPDAVAIGAVNTVVLREGRSVGHNTDCWGFAESFRCQMEGASLDAVLLIGAGGAGMAVGRAILDLGAAQVVIFDLDHSKASALARSLSFQFGRACAEAAKDLTGAMRAADGMVNATPMGMAKYPGLPVPGAELRHDLWVADIVYFPAETELLRKARARGSRTLPGRGMAIFQAVKAFELITGLLPDPTEMSKHFERED